MIFLDRARTPEIAAMQGALGWTQCVRCGYGVAVLNHPLLFRIAHGEIDPLCRVPCGEELFANGAMDQATYVGRMNDRGDVEPGEEMPGG